jgi:hypothetical protein
MKHYAGLDVSVKETSICIVDEAGRICREMKVVSHPEDLLAVLCDPAWRLERVGNCVTPAQAFRLRCSIHLIQYGRRNRIRTMPRHPSTRWRARAMAVSNVLRADNVPCT